MVHWIQRLLTTMMSRTLSVLAGGAGFERAGHPPDGDAVRRSVLNTLQLLQLLLHHLRNPLKVDLISCYSLDLDQLDKVALSCRN